MIYSVVALAAFAAVTSAKIFVEDLESQKFAWASYKQEWRKNYGTPEEDSSRFAIFLENLKIIDDRNEAERLAGGSAIHGLTKFSDLSQEEFAQRFLKSDATMRSGDRRAAPSLEAPNKTMGLVDWTGIYTTPVKDQGYCGSCWAFSATEQIESDYMRATGQTYLLSPEQITQCDKTSSGCNGGWTEHAFNYVARAGGIETEADYPYTSYQGRTGSCSEDSSKFVVSISGYTPVSSEDEMATYVQTTGPLSVCVDANSWNSYNGGVMSKCGTSVDHCVQAVGVDTSSYWKVRNSWGTNWGESGFIRLAYGHNTCAIASDPTYVNIGKK